MLFFFFDRFTTLRIFLFGQIGSVDLNPLKEYFFLFIKLIECCLFCLTILKGVFNISELRKNLFFSCFINETLISGSDQFSSAPGRGSDAH